MMHELHGTAVEDRRQEAYRVARTLYRQDPDWVTFFREILGIGGVVRRLFPGREELAEFERTTEYAEIQLMLARLRQRSNAAGGQTRSRRGSSRSACRRVCTRRCRRRLMPIRRV